MHLEILMHCLVNFEVCFVKSQIRLVALEISRESEDDYGTG